MARKVKKPEYNCPVEATLAVIGGRWKALILFHLRDQTLRFAALRRKIPGISERMLTQQLRELEGDGVVRREVYPEVPPRVEYSLTDYGRTLRPITDLMCAWGKEHVRRATEPQDAGRRTEEHDQSGPGAVAVAGGPRLSAAQPPLGQR
jgi:DNA-binding HxlR family transcriptional regulator